MTKIYILQYAGVNVIQRDEKSALEAYYEVVKRRVKDVRLLEFIINMDDGKVIAQHVIN